MKVMTLPHPLNGSFKHAPTCLRHGVGGFSKHRPNVHAMKEGGTILTVVYNIAASAMSWRRCVSL